LRAEANSTVKVFAGDTSLGTAAVFAHGAAHFLPRVPLANGSHTLTARATDAAGNVSAESAGLTLTIDDSEPMPWTPGAPDLVAATDTGLHNDDNVTALPWPTFTGTARPGSTVEVFDYQRWLGTASVDVHGRWTFVSPPLADGPHLIRVRAANRVGLSDLSEGLSIYVDSSGRLANPLADATPRLRVSVAKRRRVRGWVHCRPVSRFRWTLTLTTTTAKALEGPLVLALDGLDPRVRLLDGWAGRSPSVQVMPARGSLASGQSVTLTLTFGNPLMQPLRFTPRVLSGFGTL
jgi:hypothetical protein